MACIMLDTSGTYLRRDWTNEKPVESLSKNIRSDLANEKHFEIFSKNEPVVSDKVTAHKYQQMYGLFLMPLLHQAQHSSSSIKMLEIGLGCDMIYGPGASSHLWKNLFGSHVELWEADVDANCVKNMTKQGKMKGINTLVGSQSDIRVLEEWTQISGGKFDVIIDDGGHKNKEIMASFNVLFHKALLPGGYYFIEDLQVGRHQPYTDEKDCVADVIESWIDQLLINDQLMTASVLQLR